MTETNALAQIVNSQKVHEVSGQPLIVVPDDFNVADLEKFLPAPRRVRATPVFRSGDSFIEYVRRFASEATVVFADEKQSRLTAIIDYHQSGDSPAWCDHTASYECPYSKEWQAWVAHDGKNIEQGEFAEFLEERAQDVVTPTGAELLEIALQFKVIRKAAFGSAIRLNTGEFQFQFSEENQKGTVELPEVIHIGVAPFHNGEKYEVKARLRYRLREGRLTLSYHLMEPHRFVEHAFRELITKVDDSLENVAVYEAKA